MSCQCSLLYSNIVSLWWIKIKHWITSLITENETEIPPVLIRHTFLQQRLLVMKGQGEIISAFLLCPLWDTELLPFLLPFLPFHLLILHVPLIHPLHVMKQKPFPMLAFVFSGSKNKLAAGHVQAVLSCLLLLLWSCQDPCPTSTDAKSVCSLTR